MSHLDNKINGKLFLQMEKRNMMNDLGLSYGFKALVSTVIHAKVPVYIDVVCV